MKKIISAALSLLMVLSLFAACSDNKKDSDLANAKAYLTNMYQTAEKDKAMELLMDKDVLSVVTIDGVSYEVEWTIDVTKGKADSVKVTESDKENHVTIDVPDLPEEDIEFTATATVKDEKGNSESLDLKYMIKGLNISTGDGEGEGEGNETEDTTSDTTSNLGTSSSSGNSGNSGNTSSSAGGNKAPSSMTAIVDEAYKLAEGKSLSYTATLTGKVVSVDDLYDEEFKNITVTIAVAGRESKPIKCYRMKGTDVSKVAKGDTITVTGVIKNYYGEIEFDLGCVMNKRVSGGGKVETQLTDSKAIVEAAFKLKNGEQMSYDVTLTGKVISISEPYNSQFENVSALITVEGKNILCYRMKGNDADKVKEGDTITVTGRIKNFNGTVEFDLGCTMRARVAGTSTVTKTYAVVDAPKAGVAYKFGMVQGNVSSSTVYYLMGGMSGYYMATASSPSAAIDVYLESTTGGYYLYTKSGSTKQYINMVVSGTHVNGQYSDKATTVYTYDATAKTVVATVNDAPYWFGTRNDKNYTTVGPCKTEYEGFYCKFYAEK
ncbi:MAG: DUF2291 domain-containing protein [Ruminococcaceae bacterium]|nr:DUF2291 domain-containing protein [Oscillospiraceae bacterium]